MQDEKQAKALCKASMNGWVHLYVKFQVNLKLDYFVTTVQYSVAFSCGISIQ